LRRTIVNAAIVLAAAGLLVGCGTRATASATDTPGPADRSSAVPRPVATIADRGGPSWSGELGDTVQIDWYVQSSGKTISEQIAVLQVRRVADPQPSGPYDWRYGIKVRLTSLSEQTAQAPAAYQFLTLSDGARRTAWPASTPKADQTLRAWAGARSAGCIKPLNRASSRQRSSWKSAPGGPDGHWNEHFPP
jgi:hypothetical protein